MNKDLKISRSSEQRYFSEYPSNQGEKHFETTCFTNFTGRWCLPASEKEWGWIWTLDSKWFKSRLFILHLGHHLPMIYTKDKLFFCEHTIYLNSIAQNNQSSSKKTIKHINSNNIRHSENPRYGHLWMKTTFEVNSQNCVWNFSIGSCSGVAVRINEK